MNDTIIQQGSLADGAGQMVVEDFDNRVRSFPMYEVLERPLVEFLANGDGFSALATYEEAYYPDAQLVDATLINFVKFIATAFGRSKLAQGIEIVRRIEREHGAKTRLRFRSKHPLFVDGSSRYQNICLVSGMVHLGIPILPYFDGVNVVDESADVDEYMTMLRGERMLRMDTLDAFE